MNLDELRRWIDLMPMEARNRPTHPSLIDLFFCSFLFAIALFLVEENSSLRCTENMTATDQLMHPCHLLKSVLIYPTTVIATFTNEPAVLVEEDPSKDMVHGHNISHFTPESGHKNESRNLCI